MNLVTKSANLDTILKSMQIIITCISQANDKLKDASAYIVKKKEVSRAINSNSKIK